MDEFSSSRPLAGPAVQLPAAPDPPPSKSPPSCPPKDHRLVAGPMYESFDELAADLKDWAASTGFCFSIRRKKNPDKQGRPTRVELYCDRARSRPSRGQGIRSTTTHKTSACTWKAVCQALLDNNRRWTVRFEGEHRGHDASERLTEHVGHRILTDEQQAYIFELFDIPGLRNRSIVDRLLVKWPGIAFVQKDIENMRARHNKKRLGGYTPTQALVKRFVDQKVRHVVRYDPHDEDRVLSLVWTYPWCEEQ